MSRILTFFLFYLAVFLQAGAYGLTFLLPDLFAGFGADEKTVGQMLFITTLATLASVWFAGHIADLLGRLPTLGVACLAIAAALAGYGLADGVGPVLIAASLALGAGWGLTYSLAPVVLTGLVTAAERVRYFALNSVSLMAGFGLSPVLAAGMTRWGYTVQDAFYLTGLLSAVAGVLFFVLRPAVHTYEISDGGGAQPSRLSLGGALAICRSPAWLPVVMVTLGASVFAGMNNFQTVMAAERGLDYAGYFLIYTITVVIFRAVLSRFSGGPNPYRTIAWLQYIMGGSVLLFLLSGASVPLYWLVAVLFGIGYGVSYPILAAMAANDARDDLVPQTLQLFALTYFIGIFGFPLLAGWVLVEMGTASLLILCTGLAVVEATMALVRALGRKLRSG